MLLSNRRQHEAFVTNPHGCGVIRTFTFVFQTFLTLFLVRYLNLYSQKTQSKLPKFAQFFIENVIVFVPMVLSVTICSSYCYLIFIVVFLSTLSAIYLIRKAIPLCKETEADTSLMVPNRLSIYPSLKCNVIVSTITLILAVDFPVFPRAYAKTEHFGLGIMDIGAILFLALNSAVAIEIRTQKKFKKWTHFIRTIKTSFPILAIGVARTLTLKAINYHEKVTEYGVHLNFFILLAIVKVVSSFVRQTVKSNNLLVSLSAATIVLYEIALQRGLSAYVHSNGPRLSWIDQNKEGLLSIPNLVAFNLLFQQAIQPLYACKSLNTERLVRFGFILRFLKLAFLSAVISTTAYYLTESFSRRSNNLSFLFMIFVLLFVLIAMEYLGELLAIGQFGINLTLQPTTSPFLLAYSNNGLTLFLHANVMTGLINLSIDTINASTLRSMTILSLYLVALSVLGYGLEKRVKQPKKVLN